MEEKAIIGHQEIVIKATRQILLEVFKLLENFKSVDARGPMDVIKEDGSLDPEYRMFLRQDSFQRVQALINFIKGIHRIA